MLTKNVRSGIGSMIDEARAGLHAIDRAFMTSVRVESAGRPLAPGTPLRALRQGAFCSLTERGEVQPFSERAPVAGLVNRLYDDRGRTMVSVHVRGAVCLRVQGLTEASAIGAAVYVTEAQQCNLDGRGVEIGSLLAVESGEKALGIVGFKLPGDTRPLALSGRGFRT
jgi:hypothetical protein